MKLRTDLWKDANPSSAFSQLKNRVRDLLSHPEWTTLLLKGPWGCGKTSAVKSLLVETKDPSSNDSLKIKAYSFVSLAGVSKIGDERSLFLSGLDDWNRLPIKKVRERAAAVGNIGKSLLAAFGFGGRTEGLPDLLAVMIGPFMSGALVVVDDLERRSESLPLDDALGAVMRLVEVRQCKVIVISNEDALKEQDKEKLDAAREKLFDLEFLFSPSVAEVISAVVPVENDRKRLLPTFEALGLNNVRIVSKVDLAVAQEFAKQLPWDDLDTRERVLENVIKICTFRWHKGISIEEGMLDSAFGLEMRQDMKSEFNPLEVTPIADLIIKTSFEPSEADAPILEYLRTGRIDQKRLLTAFEAEKSHVNERRVKAVLDKLTDAFTSGFQPIDQELIDQAQDTLDNSIEAFFQWAYAYRLIQLLEFCGRSNLMATAERRWAKGCRLGLASGQESVEQLVDEQARAILRQRLKERDLPSGTQNFSQMIAQHRFPESLALILEHLPNPDWVFEQLQSANVPGLMPGLIAFLDWLSQPEIRAKVVDSGEALRAALKQLANQSSLDQQRVNYILRPKTAPGPQGQK